jgi:hypothetical protein
MRHLKASVLLLIVIILHKSGDLHYHGATGSAAVQPSPAGQAAFGEQQHPQAFAEQQQPNSHHAHAQAELIYWEARERAQALRSTFPPEVLSNSNSNLSNIVRAWDFYAPDYNCPLLKERVGRIGDGGKWVCGMRLLSEARRCLVYSLGSQGDTTFEDEFLSRTLCEVHTFDPFLSADTQTAVENRPGLHFHPVGILGSAGEILVVWLMTLSMCCHTQFLVIVGLT